MKGYFYLHTNGDLIWKPAIVVDSEPGYFDSPFVKRVWKIDTENRATYIAMLSLAKQDPTTRPNRIKELETKWNVTEKDYECLRRIKNGEDYSKVLKEIFGE